MKEKRKYVKYTTKSKLDKVCEENKIYAKRFFNYKSLNLSESTKKSYQNDLDQFFVFLKDRYDEGIVEEEDLLEIMKDDIGIDDMVDILEDYITFCIEKLGNNERRMQRRMATLSSLFGYFLKKRKIKVNPMDFIERIRIRPNEKPQVKQTYLTKEQVETIRRKLKKGKELQLTAFFEVALSTMARVNALSNIKISQIDFDNGIIKEVLEKEGKVVNLFPSDRALKAIKAWIKEREEIGFNSDHLFLSKKGEKISKVTIQTRWIKDIGDYVDEDLHVHDLRHSGSNLLYQKGMKLEDVSTLLNHSGTDVTRAHYLQENYDKIQEDKKKLEI